MESSDVKRKAQELGFELVGVCAAVEPPHLEAYRAWLAKGYHGVMGYMERQARLREHPENLLSGVRSIVAVGLNYNQPNPTREGYPHIARYALGRDYHRVLRGKLGKLARWIQASSPEAECRACVDTAPIFERDYAQLAGLGWFGKNTCLIDSRRGSWFVLGLLLTTLDLAPDRPATGGCGSCRACVDACPTGAIVLEDGRWQVDARKCVSYLTIEVPAAGLEPPGRPSTDWAFGCDVCQEVCPFNQSRGSQPLRARTTSEPDFLARREWPKLIDLARMDFEAWDILTRGSAVRRAGLQGLKNNIHEPQP